MTVDTTGGHFWAGRAVLVTGGCGFIGSHLVESLLEAGAHVRVIGRYNSRSHKGFLEDVTNPRLSVELGDVSDPWFVQRMAEGVDTIFHLAALIGIPYSYVAPWHYVTTNVAGTVCVLEAARSNSVRRVVHTSTSETYGTAQYTPIDERHPMVGQSPYSASKIAADKMAESYHLSYGLPVVTVRPFNAYGPRQSMRAIIPTLMTQALHADEIRVGSLHPVRDMTYVSDTVRGFLASGQAEGIEGEVLNIGSGIGHSVADILAAVQQVAGTDKPVRIDSERERPVGSEVEVLVCDYSRAQELLGYAPRVSLSEGLTRVRDAIAAAPPPANVNEYRR